MSSDTEKSGSKSTVYGPVDSWRLGKSLGIDVLFQDSICSFRCIYCQLGRINRPTAKRDVFVPTSRILRDLTNFGWDGADVATFSGSGEPTLAHNLGETIRGVRRLTSLPVVVLTNSAHLGNKNVVDDLKEADHVFCKLDSVDDKLFAQINRPLEGVSLRSTIDGLTAFAKVYEGNLAIQTMYRELGDSQFEELAETLVRIGPDEIQVNTASRPIPREWFLDARGNYELTPYPSIQPRRSKPEYVLTFANRLGNATGLPVVTAQTKTRKTGKN